MQVALFLDLGRSGEERQVSTRNWLPAIVAMDVSGIHGRLITSGPMGELHRTASDRGWPVLALGHTTWQALGTRAPLTVARFISEHGADLVHAHEVIPTVVAGIASRLGDRHPIIFHRHHTYSSRKHAIGSRLAARVAQRTFAVSRAAAAAAIADDHSDQDDVLVMPNGVSSPRSVDRGEVRALRARLTIGIDHTVVVCVGRMRREKGQDVAIDAVVRATRTIPNLHLVLVGTGPEEAALRARAATFREKVSIHFVGHQEDVAPWLHLGDLVLVPSLREASPLVVLEAMASARPILATRVGGIPEVLDALNGALVEPGNASALGSMIVEVLSDTEQMQSMGIRGLEEYRRSYTVEAMVQRWHTGYEIMLTRMKGP